jgi:hypothetical protein
LNITEKDQTSLFDTDLIELIQSLVYELEENNTKIQMNIFIFQKNIELSDSGKMLLANPISLEKTVWENSKINKILLLNKLPQESNSIIKSLYLSVDEYNEIVNNRNKYLLENQAMNNYFQQIVQNDKNLLESSTQIRKSFEAAITHFKKLIGNNSN